MAEKKTIEQRSIHDWERQTLYNDPYVKVFPAEIITNGGVFPPGDEQHLELRGKRIAAFLRVSGLQKLLRLEPWGVLYLVGPLPGSARSLSLSGRLARWMWPDRLYLTHGSRSRYVEIAAAIDRARTERAGREDSIAGIRAKMEELERFRETHPARIIYQGKRIKIEQQEFPTETAFFITTYTRRGLIDESHLVRQNTDLFLNGRVLELRTPGAEYYHRVWIEQPEQVVKILEDARARLRSS
jgi:hypothetical protein